MKKSFITSRPGNTTITDKHMALRGINKEHRHIHEKVTQPVFSFSARYCQTREDT